MISLSKAQKTLKPRYYTDENTFKLEQQHLFPNQLFYVAHNSEFSQPGQFKKVTVQTDQILLSQQLDNSIVALANRCLHRGATLTRQEHGISKKLTCPYHAWTYELDGTLISTRQQLPELEHKHCLHHYDIQDLGGLQLLSLKPNNENSAAAIKNLAPYFDFYGVKETNVVATKQMHCQANWKIVTENFLECYHCSPCHPQLSSAEGHVALLENNQIDQFISLQNQFFHRADALKHLVPPPKFIEPTSPIYSVINGVHLAPPRATGTQSGELVGTLLGNQTGVSHGFIYGSLGPFVHFTIYADYVVLFSFEPISVDDTRVTVTWLTQSTLPADKIQELRWLWQHTIEQDCHLCEMVQEQANSSAAVEGYYTDMEADSAFFSLWYEHHFLKRYATELTFKN